MKKRIKDIFLKLISKKYTQKFTKLSQWFIIFSWKNENWKVEKLIAHLQDKTEYVIYIKNLNQALIHGLFLKNVHRVIEFNKKTWLKPNINMNTYL